MNLPVRSFGTVGALVGNDLFGLERSSTTNIRIPYSDFKSQLSDEFQLSKYLTTQFNQFSAGISGGNTAGDTGTVTNRLVLAGGNNITVSGATDANGMSVTLSGPNTIAQSVQTLGLY